MSTLSLRLKPLPGAFFIVLDRFRDVPFFLNGKRLTKEHPRQHRFKQMDSIFGEPLKAKCATIYIQPTEGLSLSLNGKEVGELFNLAPMSLDYRTDATASRNSQTLMKN